MSPEQNLVRRLTVMYGEPRTEDPAAYIQEFTKAVAGFPADVLDRAGDIVIRTSTFWPKPAEVIEEANRILANRSNRSAYIADLDERERRWKSPSPEERARVRELMARLNMVFADKQDSAYLHTISGVSRGAFEDMQRDSPNVRLHRRLTQASRRMSGEHDE